MLDDIVKAIPFGIVLSLTIGPVFFVLLETSATKGFKSALIFDFGVILADVLFIGLAFFSAGNLLEKIKDEPNFLVVGGMLLVVYGIISFIKTSKSFRSIVREYHKVELKKSYFKIFAKGFLLNFINIGVLLGWLGFIVIGTSITTTKNGAFIFISTMLATYLAVDIIKITLAKRLKKKLTPRLIYKTKKVVAILILVFGVILMVEGLFPEVYETSKKQIDKVNPIKIQQE